MNLFRRDPRSPLRLFADRWGGDYHAPPTVKEEDLAEIEAFFDVVLPRDYRERVLDVGLPSPTFELLDRIADRPFGRQLDDLSALHTPSEIRSQTLRWRAAGLPENLLAIGSDSLGNTFAFDMTQLRGGGVIEAPIWFWDHDFGSTKQVAKSFSAWIDRYVRL